MIEVDVDTLEPIRNEYDFCEHSRIGNSNGLLAPPRRLRPPPPHPGLVRATRRAAAACRSGPQPGGMRRRALWLVLDRRLRMGEDSASGVPWGDGLGTGDVGRLEGGDFKRDCTRSEGVRHPAAARTSLLSPRAMAWA